LLQGKYELRRHLGSLPPDGELYLTFAGEPTAPAPKLLLLRPRGAAPDVRVVGEVPDVPGVPPVLDRFETAEWWVEVLETSASAPLAPADSEPDALRTLAGLTALQQHLAEGGYDCAGCTPAAVRAGRDGLVYCGPLVVGDGAADPTPLLDYLLQGGPFSREWRNAIAQWRQAPGEPPAALAPFGAEQAQARTAMVSDGRATPAENQDAAMVRRQSLAGAGQSWAVDLLAVADGMGGHRAGAAAAAAALAGFEAGLAV
jgi:hypothetical protein